MTAVVRARDLMDLPEVAEAAGWTVESARVMYYRANSHRRTGNIRPGDLPRPLRVVSGRYPIWLRSDIEHWTARRRAPKGPST